MKRRVKGSAMGDVSGNETQHAERVLGIWTSVFSRGNGLVMIALRTVKNRALHTQQM